MFSTTTRCLECQGTLEGPKEKQKTPKNTKSISAKTSKPKQIFFTTSRFITLTAYNFLSIWINDLRNIELENWLKMGLRLIHPIWCFKKSFLCFSVFRKFPSLTCYPNLGQRALMQQIHEDDDVSLFVERQLLIFQLFVEGQERKVYERTDTDRRRVNIQVCQGLTTNSALLVKYQRKFAPLFISYFTFLLYIV